MKLSRILICFLLTVLFSLGTITLAEDEVVIDVLDGELVVLSYRMELAEKDKPITVDRVDGEYVLFVNSKAGDVRIVLGDVTIALTERSVPFITFAFGGESGATPDTTKDPFADKCRYCGVGNLLEHICPRCSTPYCIHDDIACSYRLNPAPTPWNTKDPDGVTVYFYLSPDGTYYIGNPENKKPTEWSPSSTYMDAIATPKPTETPLPRD